MSKTQKLIKQLKTYFLENKNVEMAFLFGSQTKGRATTESDFDIAVWLIKDNQKEITKIWDELEDLLKRNVDLIVLNSASPTISWTALRGIPLLIRNQRFYLEYMLDVSREAQDFQEFIIDLWELRKKYRKIS